LSNMSSSLSSFIGSLFASEPIHNDEAPAPDASKEDASAAEESEDKASDEAPAEEEEEDDPEDIAPALREECEVTPACSGYKKHFDHCTETVNDGKGFKHEDCVEELCDLMHCVDNCVAPRLFSKLS
ncbi:Non-heme 11 kDa protein of cytochrome bc1 complex, partial [Clavulina sp. PMI_390]